MRLRTLARRALRNRTHPTVAVGVGLAATQVANIATTTWLHRSLAHNAVTFDPRVVKVYDLIIRCSTGMEPNEWAAVHQQHHAHSDEAGDPHSPLMDGLATVQFNNVGEYKQAAKTEAVQRRRDLLPATPYEHVKWLSGGRGLIFGIGAAAVLLGPVNGLIVSLVHWPAYIGLSASVNSSHAFYRHETAITQGKASHLLWHFYNRFGYRNYETGEYSSNQRWLAWLTMGEGLHNNHHGKPSSPNFNHKPEELDFGWMVIRWLERRGLATVRNPPITLP
ncbi:MAG: hypothetical protein QG658_602 [Patescibacteria group bacterium]|nr:hypothetical protein [Patescibacteria group bacterium]